MSILSGLNTENETIEEQGDVLGGSRVWDTDLYKAKIDMAYLGQSQGGANSLTLHFKRDDGSELRITEWITSGTAKGCKPYYEKNGKKFDLPGFATAKALALIACDKQIHELEEEGKVIKLYDFDAKKELPREVPVLTEMLGAEVNIAVTKQIVDKSVKNDAGVYVPTGDTREENVLSKVFYPEGHTMTEKKAGAEPVFAAKWLDKNKGKTVNRAKGSTSGATAGAPTPAATGAGTGSLFS